MRGIFKIALLEIALASFFVVLAAAQTGLNPSAHWEGFIHLPGQDLAMTLDLARGSTGAWVGSLSFPKTTTIDVPISSVSVEGAAVAFTVPGLEGDARFEGKLDGENGKLQGLASNAKGAVPFEVSRTGEASVKTPPP